MPPLHPIEPHASLVSARIGAGAVFVVAGFLACALLFALMPPTLWWVQADAAVTFYPSDLLFILGQFRIPHLNGIGIGELAVYPARLLAAAITPLPSGDLVWLLIVRFGVAIAVALASARPVYRRVRDESPKRVIALHVDGPKPMRGKWGAAHLSQSWKQLRRQTGDGIWLAPNVKLPMLTETEGILLVGKPGSGKSVILEGLLMQALARRDRVVALDVKGGLAKQINKYQPNVFDLTGKMNVVWAIGQDLRSDSDADEFAASLIPESRDPVWSQGSRMILSALVLHLIDTLGERWGWQQLHTLLSKAPEEIESTVQTVAPEVANMIQKRGEDPAPFVLSLIFNLIAHVGATTRRFAKMENTGARRVSLRAWSTAGKWRRPIVLRYDLQRREHSANFVKLVLRLLAGTLLGDEVEDNVDWRIWLFLDEVTRLGRCDAVGDLASMGRSRGVRSIVSVQSPAQLRDIYGEAGEEGLRENFGVQIVCGLPPGDNARRVATQWIPLRTVREPYSSKNNEKPREWTIPAISVAEYSSDFGLRYNIWGRPYIRAAVLGLGDVPVVDWTLHRWPPKPCLIEVSARSKA